MSQKNESRAWRITRDVLNSPGIWILLFAGFGLLSISLAEEKIQNRMRRQVTRSRFFESRTDEAGKAVAESPHKLTKSDKQDWPERMTGLRWILAVSSIGGLVLMILAWARALRIPG